MFRKGDEPIPGYRLDKFLGKGQFGEVWKTTAPGGTAAALKFIDLGGKQGLKEFRGVQRVKEIRHANLMPITAIWMLDSEGNLLSDDLLASYDPDRAVNTKATMAVGNTIEMKPEWLVVAMLLGKKNLMDRLEESLESGQQGIPVEELLRYMEEAAKGIDYLNTPQHDLGEGKVALQHCDIKPANIMLIGDAAVVCDFGLARVLSDSTATATGMVGSPAYMPPENIARKPGPGSDQYSLAVSYVELRTGRLPFAELNYIEVMEANRQAKLELSRLPPAEQQVIRKATSLNPSDRYPSTLAMVQALRRAVEGIPAPPSGGRKMATLAALLALAITAPVAAWGIYTILMPPVAPQQDQQYVLTFDPADATVLLNDTPQQLDAEGKLSANLADNALVSIEASHPDYRPIKQQFSLEEMRKAEFKIRLSHTGAFFARRAYQQLDKGDFSAAVAEYKEAIAMDATFEVPEAIECNEHTKSVQVLAFSPDGKWLVSAGQDGLACLWPLADPRTRVAPIVLAGHAPNQLIESIAVSRDGRWMVTGSWDDTAIVWDLSASDPAATGRKLTGHGDDVIATTITADSRWIVTGSMDGTIRLWPLASGQPSQDAQALALDAAIAALRVSSDGHWLVGVDIEGNASRWDLSAAQPANTKLNLGKISMRVMQLTPDGKWLIAGTDDGKLGVYATDQPSSQRVFPCAADAIESLAVADSGRLLLAGDTGGNVYQLELKSDGEPVNPVRFEAHIGECVAIATASSGEFALTGSWDQTGRYWELGGNSGKSPWFLSLSGRGSRVVAVAISRDGKWMATATDSGKVLLWDVGRCRLILHATGGDLPRPKGPLETRRRLPLRDVRWLCEAAIRVG